MHWIQTLREQLHITQEELGHYLQLSYHTIKSVEQGRRSLPPESLMAAAALFEAIKNTQTTRVAVSTYTPASHHHTGRAKWLHRQCCRKLDKSVDELEKMKKSHTAARFALEVYQTLVQSLLTPATKEDQDRLVWAQRQINDTKQRINDTCPMAQNLVAAEIVGLKNIVHSLDLIQLNSEHNTPLVNGPGPLQP